MGELHPNVVSQPLSADQADEAVIYLNRHADGASNPTVNLRALRRKIDRRLMPYMFCCYVLQFLDKVMLNYAAVMGIKKDLNLVGNDFSNTATWFFIAYLIAEVPNVYCLQKVPPGKWLGANVVLWGVAAAASAGAHGYRGLLVARIFLGIFEATVGPSLMLISSQYYTRSEQAPRFTVWYMGLGVAQIIGGLISFAFQHVQHASLERMADYVPYLGTSYSCLALLQHVSENQTGVWSTTFDLKQIREAALDVQLWLLTVTTILISVSSGVVTTYSSTLIAGFGFSGPISALLNMPSGIVSIVFTLLVGIGIRKTSNRWAWNVLCTIPGIIGGALLSFLPKTNKAGVLIGIYLVNAIVATLPILYQWTMANCAGHTKRAFASALVAGSFSVGNIIGPQTFQSRDAPEYRPAKIAVLATQAAAAVLSAVLFVYYKWQNRHRDQIKGHVDESKMDGTKWAGLTDKQNPSFRYVY
ncbi:uncharacterized protein N7515_009905 [Penicillium bovifimosum]|uniref:Major facilitator superfamily (MFS) profile domain-containing protein n=1 Tax=Penicillium bovifimosum TaxID=126998 RepID=A0A9W9KUK8_9EURO|nr:uncharacterized protein N7515_009905 [Penicillium bovifimosum]KAJ5120517.1 hypothetical protein N7515_009905 [Penicillium bovifimosum]